LKKLNQNLLKFAKKNILNFELTII